jgi:hypothetical protein
MLLNALRNILFGSANRYQTRSTTVEPDIINGHKTRKQNEDCDGCHAHAAEWCAADCDRLDLGDYR